ncbi:MAG TPA: hypothetical protein VJX70_12920 [Candidatus Acidoferrum sp.]|nr:hypothetical protein [Candidatus Acidoferrum sp.]
MKSRLTNHLNHLLGLLAALALLSTPLLANENDSILKSLKTIDTISPTVPANGDINPYGLVQVPSTVGNLREGHYLVSNFNASSNAQGTGTTIVDVAPDGTLTLFSQLNASSLPGPCPGGVGLTTALAVLKTGWVIVGSLPTTDGTSATAQAGCLIVLDSKGNAVETIQGSLINGPWDMTALDGDHQAVLFVTNVLNGTLAANGSVVDQGTVVRVNLAVSQSSMPVLESLTVIGSGFPERTDPAALVIGPTGVGLSPNCGRDAGDCGARFGEDEAILYVADSLNNRVTVITDPLTRTRATGPGAVLTSGGRLNDPLGLTVAQNGHILVVNGNDGYITEITPRGSQIASKLIDSSGNPPGAGALFGLVFDPERGVVFVDDATNTLNLLH